MKKLLFLTLIFAGLSIHAATMNKTAQQEQEEGIKASQQAFKMGQQIQAQFNTFLFVNTNYESYHIKARFDNCDEQDKYMGAASSSNPKVNQVFEVDKSCCLTYFEVYNPCQTTSWLRPSACNARSGNKQIRYSRDVHICGNKTFTIGQDVKNTQGGGVGVDW